MHVSKKHSPDSEVTSVRLSPLVCVYTYKHRLLWDLQFPRFLKELQMASYPASSSPYVPLITQAPTSHAEDGKPRQADAVVGALDLMGCRRDLGAGGGREVRSMEEGRTCHAPAH